MKSNNLFLFIIDVHGFFEGGRNFVNNIIHGILSNSSKSFRLTPNIVLVFAESKRDIKISYARSREYARKRMLEFGEMPPQMGTLILPVSFEDIKYLIDDEKYEAIQTVLKKEGDSLPSRDPELVPQNTPSLPTFKQIIESYGESATHFDYLKEAYPQINSFNRFRFLSDKRNFEFALNIEIELEDKLLLLKTEKKKIASIINSWFFHYIITMGKFELTKIATLAGQRDELIKAFPEITDLIESIPVIVRLNKTTPENTQALSKISESFTKLEFNIHYPIQLLNTVLESNKPFSEFDRTFLKDFVTILESGDVDYQMTNQMLEFYYTQKYYDFICEKHDALKAEMNGESNDTVKSKLHWRKKRGDKINLIRTLLAFHDMYMIEDENGSTVNQTDILREFGRFLNIDLSSRTDFSNATERSPETNTAFFRKMIKAIEKRCENRE